MSMFHNRFTQLLKTNTNINSNNIRSGDHYIFQIFF